jgi:hypothetical protein
LIFYIHSSLVKLTPLTHPILFVKWYRAVAPSPGATDPQRAKRVTPKAVKIHITFYLSLIPETIAWFVLLFFASVIIVNKVLIHLPWF